MRNIFLVAVAAAILPSTAFAQGAYVGAQVGYHDIDVDTEEDGDFGLNGLLYGLYAGYDVAVADNWIAGLEVNFNLATNDLDSDYGVAARIGYIINNKGLVYLRGGYQEVNLDVQSLVEEELGRNLTGTEEAELDSFDLDDDDGGYLVGIGGEYNIQENMALRIAVDTIEFDSARITAGIAFRF